MHKNVDLLIILIKQNILKIELISNFFFQFRHKRK